MLKKLLIVGVAVFALYTAWQQWSHRSLEQPAGVLAPDAPVQGELSQPHIFRVDDYILAAQASYKMRARLLSRESYSFDREADLSPVDFALGWGPMSNTAVLDELEISQSVRFYSLRWQTPPIPKAAIMQHSANTHIVPATSRIADKIDAMRPGQIIELEGYLVNAIAEDGWRWQSSLTRKDTGAGACELFWVEEARVINP